MTQPILVTGAFGQLGQRVAEVLLQRDRTVVATDLRTPKTAAAAEALSAMAGPGHLVPAWVDLTDAAAVRTLVAEHQPEAIVHLAAVVSPPCYRNPAAARRVNVDGTAHVVSAAQALDHRPAIVLASSSAVYGSRNPYRNEGRITPLTPVNPIECYGQDKVDAEAIVTASGLPHALLRLGGILSPDGTANRSPEYFVLLRATPGDNRVHMVDARDAALAFANAVERIADVDGQVLLIGGDESFVHTHTSVQDEVFAAVGLGRPGPAINLPGDPDDDRGWGLTDWFDTTGSEQALQFQRHHWSDTMRWMAQAQPLRPALVATGPVLRPLLRGLLSLQRRRERRGPYADPWLLVERIYGPEVLVPVR